MFCSKCGSKNNEGAKFCTNCGETLVNSEKPKMAASSNNAGQLNNPGGIRKAIKKDAKNRVKGYMIGATAVFLIINMVISSIFGESSVETSNPDFSYKIGMNAPYISSILTILVEIIFGYGFLYSCFKVVRGEESNFTEIFKSPFDNIKKIGYILLLILAFAAAGFVAGILAIIPIIGFFALIGLMVALVYYAPAITTFSMILADPNNKEELSFQDTVKKAIEISKGHGVEYYGVTFSFIGWLLLSMLTCGILLIWLIPYMQLTMVNMYRRWVSEANFEATETGLSNGAVIGFTFGGCGCAMVVLTVLFAGVIAVVASVISKEGASIQDIIDGIEEYDNNHEISNTIDRYTNDLKIVLK